METKIIEKLNKLSVKELFDLYWLKMYPYGLIYEINDGEIRGISNEI